LRKALAALVVIGAVALSGAAQAAPPANDLFVNAQPLLGPAGSVTGTNLEATKEPGEPNHANDAGGRSVWFQWTAPFSGPAVVGTCGATTFDTLLGVYVGSNVAALGAIAANDDSCGDRSQAEFNAVAGSTYSIAVDGFERAAGNFTLTWGPLLPPSNDNLAAAQSLSGARGSVDGTLLGATREPGEARHGATRPYGSVWYRWTAGVTGGVGFDTCRGSAFDSVLAAYTGTPGSRLTHLVSNDDGCLIWSRVRFLARAGQTYSIAVDGEGSVLGERRGGFTLSWLAAARPPNDDFARARRIRGARGSVRGSNLGATGEAGERSHARSPAGASMWYRWRAPRTMRVTFETCRSGFDTVLAVYRGSSVRRMKLLRANDDACRGQGRVVVRVTRGVEYRVVVDGFRSSTGSFSLKWSPAR
jgi:hypothetical protein